MSFYKFDGDSLEPFLLSGAIALLDAKWLSEFAAAQPDATRLACRQAMPKEAFVSFDTLVEQTYIDRFCGSLPIVALSYMWLTPHHPDPDGATLRLVGEALTDRALNKRGIGVFWDFASLYQKPRTEEQDQLFRQGLQALALLYAHRFTYVFKVTELPFKNKEKQEDSKEQHEGIFPDNHTHRGYYDRGWPFVESCWAGLGKMYSDQVVDASLLLNQDSTTTSRESSYGRRYPPLPPEAFSEMLRTKTFTNDTQDRPLVEELYRRHFLESFKKADHLDYYKVGWDDMDGSKLAEVLAAGYTPSLETLRLQNNKLGRMSCDIFATALRERKLPLLEELDLTNNDTIGESIALLAPHLSELKTIVLINTGMTDEDGATLFDLIPSRLEDDLIEETHCLSYIDVSNNKLGDLSYQAMENAILSGRLPLLSQLSIRENQWAVRRSFWEIANFCLSKRFFGALADMFHNFSWPRIESVDGQGKVSDRVFAILDIFWRVSFLNLAKVCQEKSIELFL